MTVRLARDDDWPAIREVHPAGASFVSVSGNVVAGHVMNTWNLVCDVPVLQLSPLGVLPEHQRQGHGSALARASVDAVRARGEPALIVEGNPDYYGRFGFMRADELGLLPPAEALHEWAVQVAVFDEARLPRGQIVYSAPFRA